MSAAISLPDLEIEDPPDEGVKLPENVKPIPVSQEVSIKKAFPLMGNVLFDVMGDFSDLGKAVELALEKPEIFKLLKEKHEKIMSLTGMKSMDDFRVQEKDRELALKKREQLVKTIRGNVALAMAPFLKFGFIKDKEDRLKSTEKELSRLGKEADSIIKYVIEKFFPNSNNNPATGLTNEVENIHDVGELVMISSDEGDKESLERETRGWDPKARFEAMRKLAIMETLAIIEHSVEKREAEQMGLAYFDRYMEEMKLYSTRNGKKKGYHETRYLVSEHDKTDNRCTDVNLIDDPKEVDRLIEENLNLKSTPIALRALEVEDDEGNPVEIWAMVDSRIKTITNMVLKLIRRDSIDAKEILKDLNGIRMVFANAREMGWFEKTLNKRSQNNNHKVEVTRSKLEMANGNLTGKKENVVIDGREYELQMFDFKEYTDYQYRHPYSHPEYEVDRFFDSSSSQALFPATVYGDLNRKRSHEIAAEDARRRANAKGKRYTRRVTDLSDHLEV